MYGNGSEQNAIGGSIHPGALKQAPPQGNAHNAVQVGRKLVEQLHQEVAALEVRLSPILQAEPPTATGPRDANVRAGATSAFVGAISDTNTGLETLLARLQQIASRIDL